MSYGTLAPTVELSLRYDTGSLSRVSNEYIGQRLAIYADTSDRITAAPISVDSVEIRALSPSGIFYDFAGLDIEQIAIGTWGCEITFNEVGVWHIYAASHNIAAANALLINILTDPAAPPAPPPVTAGPMVDSLGQHLIDSAGAGLTS